MPEIITKEGATVLVDDIDIDLARYTWRNHDTKKKVYVARHTTRGNKRRTIFIHREILSRMLDRTLEHKELTDHINGNPFDNRRENLRLATSLHNSQNRKVRSDSTSGLKGATPEHKRWVAQIWIDGKKNRLGRFDTPEEAHAAYCKAATEHFGEFANFGHYGLHPRLSLFRNRPRDGRESGQFYHRSHTGCAFVVRAPATGVCPL